MNKFQLLFCTYKQDFQNMDKTAYFSFKKKQIKPQNIFSTNILISCIKIMSLKQRVINFITILIFSYCLYSINRSANEASVRNQEYIHIMKLIGNSEHMDQKVVDKIGQIAKMKVSLDSQQSPVCFIKAYYQIVVKNPTNTQNLFQIFKDQYAQYEQITNCSQYYSLLIFRAQKLEQNVKQIVLDQLQTLKSQILQQKYPKAGKISSVCLYFNSYNVEPIIKEQFNALASQSYQNGKIKIEDDRSTDNTAMFIDYAMKKQHGSVTFHQNLEKKGVLKGVEKFLQECKEDSIVMLIQGNEHLLGRNALWAVDRIFSNTEADLIFFGTLTTEHMNIENILSSKQLGSQINPVIAFRKSLAKGITFEAKDFQNYERNYLATQLIKKASAVKIVEEALIYRSGRKNFTMLEQLSRLVPQSSEK